MIGPAHAGNDRRRVPQAPARIPSRHGPPACSPPTPTSRPSSTPSTRAASTATSPSRSIPQELQAVLRQAVEHYDLLAERRRIAGGTAGKEPATGSRPTWSLRQANELKKAFIKVASHELRTPLTIVHGPCPTWARKRRVCRNRSTEWLERIHVGSMRLNERVDLMIKLLLADRFERPLTPDRRGPCRPGAVPRGRCCHFYRPAPQHLEVDAPDDLGTIFVEEDKIRDCVVPAA